MAVTTAKIRAREKETGKKAYTAVDLAGGLHYAFDKPTLDSIIQKANVDFQEKQSAKAYDQVLAQAQYNNEWNANQISQMNQFNADQAQKQMNFQESMSNTAHQREVKDLIAAGLNPVLSANGGASSPSGASASGGSASADTSATAIKAQMAMQQMQIGAQIAQTNANIESAQKMAQWQNDLNRELTLAGYENQQAIANIQAAASMYGADTAASASAYASQLSSAASRYGADQSYAASKYATDNPNDILANLYKDFKGGFLGGSVSGTAKAVAADAIAAMKGINWKQVGKTLKAPPAVTLYKGIKKSGKK